MSQNINKNRILLSQMAPHVHSFNVGENKVDKLYKWLCEWIKQKLKSGEIKPGDFLPPKGELAFHIGVSKGTVQNVYRLLEDSGLIESKQRIGTYIKAIGQENSIEKLTSKQQITCQKIKQYILEKQYQIGDELVSIRTLSKELSVSTATIRIAINTLIFEKILAKNNNAFIINNLSFPANHVEQETLVQKISKKIKNYIGQNLKSGEKLPSNKEFAKKYNVSVKTIHDSIKDLEHNGIVRIRRGQYGTTVAEKEEHSRLYNYEKTEIKIKNFISKNCEIGDKLPSIRELAKYTNVSVKTVKIALDNLMEDGYVTIRRGRNGGTFITDIPQDINESYTWLAINPEYLENIN